MEKVLIYHNPRCRKSRETLEILNEKGIEPVVVEYLKNVPDVDELKSVLKKLGISAEDLIRKNEDIFKTKFKGKKYSEEQWIKILLEHPILIERPIVIKGNKAAIGRPPEKVLELF